MVHKQIQGKHWMGGGGEGGQGVGGGICKKT